MYKINLKSVLFFIIVFLFYLFLARYTESIPVSSGLGWDGVRYAKIATAPIESLKSGELPTNCLQRIVPSIISYIIIICMDRELNNQNVIISFQILNALSLTTALFYWHKICRYLKLQKKYIFLATILCFVNFHFVKFFSYYPVLTDYFSFSLCILGFYYWLKNHHYKLLIISSVLAFTWPSAFFQFLALMCFPNKLNQITSSIGNNDKITINYVYLLALSFIIYIYVFYLIKNKSYIEFDKPDNFFFFLGTINYFVTCLLICKIVSMSKYFSFENISKHVNLKFFIFSILLFITIQFIVFKTPSYSDNINIKYIFELFILRSFELPFINLLSHTIVLSPIIIILLINFRRTAEILNSFGLGANIIFILSIPFIFNSETRHLLHIYPFIVIIFVLSQNYNKFFIFLIFILQLSMTFIFGKFNTHEGLNNDLFFCFLCPFIGYNEYISFLLPFSLSIISMFLLGYYFNRSINSNLYR